MGLSIQTIAARIHVPETEVLALVQKQEGLGKATLATELDLDVHKDLFEKIGKTFQKDLAPLQTATATTSYGKVGGKAVDKSAPPPKMPDDLEIIDTPKLPAKLHEFSHSRLSTHYWLDPKKPVSAEVVAAMNTYVTPDFAFKSTDEKRACIDKLKSVATKDGAAALERFHLPRTPGGDKAKAGSVVRYSIEQEGGNNFIWQWYGPKDGKLAKESMSPELQAKFTGKSWDDLSLVDRRTYLESELKIKGALNPLVRLPDAPSHMTDKLVWEVSGPLKVWEIMTKGSYESLDQVYRAMDQVSTQTKAGGFHVHVTYEPKSVSRMKSDEAMRYTGLIGLVDLDMFAATSPNSRSPFTHPFIKVFDHGALDRVHKAMSTPMGQPEKYHNVGVRTGLYEPFSTVGFEIRGHLSYKENATNIQQWGQTAELLSDALVDGTFSDKLKFDPKAAFQFPSDINGAVALFETEKPEAMKNLFEKATVDKNHFDFRVAAPMLQWEDSPFMSVVPEKEKAAIKENIAAARAETQKLVGKLADRVAKQKGKVDYEAVGQQLNKILRQGMAQIMNGPPPEVALDNYRLVYMSRLVGDLRGAK